MLFSNDKKRKNSKTSPENNQTKQKQTKNDQTIAQKGGNIGQDGSYGISGLNSGHIQASQSYNMNTNVASPYLYNANFSQMNSGSPLFHQQLCSTPTQNTSNPDVLSLILQRLDSVDNILTQLDTIQKNFHELSVRVDKMDQKINLIENRMSDIERSRSFDSSLTDEMSKRQKDIEKIMQDLRKKDEQQRSLEAEMKAEIIDLKSRSMRDNLLFYKIAEEKDENCEIKIQNFMKENLKIETASNIKIQRAHRVGKYNGSKTRPIVVKFAFYPDRERVRKAAVNLKGTEYGISEQYPREVMETRKKLIPVMKKAREEGKEAFINVDKLYIDKRLYVPSN